MKRNQLTITYPKAEVDQLERLLLLSRKVQYLNISAFCRVAIAEKIEGLQLMAK